MRVDAPPRAAAAVPTPKSDLDHRGRAVAESALLVITTRALFLFIAYAAAWALASGAGPLTDGFFDIWVRWDARHFLEVADFGYTDPRTDPHATAFFPLFPLLVTALSAVGIPPVVGAMAITTGATFVACVFLYRLAEEEIGAGAGRRAAMYFLLFPTAVFLVAPYSEAVFLAGAIPAFYYARRERWRLVALPAAIATASRAAGIFLLLGLCFEVVRQRDHFRDVIPRAAAALGLAALPLVGYAGYLARIKGNPLYFFVDQREGWHRDFVNPIQSFRQTLELATSPSSPTNFIFTWRFEIVAAILALALVSWAIVRREWGYAAFMGSMTAALLTSTWYFSIPRMLLTMFPAVLWLAAFTGRDALRHQVAIALLAPVAALGVVVFTRGFWFY